MLSERPSQSQRDAAERTLLLWCLALALSATALAMPLAADLIERGQPARGLDLVATLVLLAPFWLAVYLQETTGIAAALTLFGVGAATGLLVGLALVRLLRRFER